MHQPAARKTAVRFDQKPAYFLNLSGCLILTFLFSLLDVWLLLIFVLLFSVSSVPLWLHFSVSLLVCSSGQHFKAVFFNHAQQLDRHTAWPFLASFPLLHG